MKKHEPIYTRFEFWLTIIPLIIGVIVNYALLNFRVNQNDERIKSLWQEVKQLKITKGKN